MSLFRRDAEVAPRCAHKEFKRVYYEYAVGGDAGLGVECNDDLRVVVHYLAKRCEHRGQASAAFGIDHLYIRFFRVGARKDISLCPDLPLQSE